MEINVKRKNNKVHFEAINEAGLQLQMDGSPEIGGENLGFRPMETILAGLGGCSSIDVVTILEKMQQPLEGINVRIRAIRHNDRVPKTFKHIHLHFELTGHLDAAKVVRALKLSLEKYCSVAKILEPTATIEHSFEIKTGA